jgi:predicted transcriptional regulator
MSPVPSQRAPSRRILQLILGPLETQVMEVLWDCDECCVRQVLPRLNRTFAYTTIMSTLNRLYRKGLAKRRKCGRAYAYSARVSCEEWKYTVARDVVVNLLAGSRSSHEALIDCLLEVVRLQEPELLEDMGITLQAKRGGIVSGYNGA